MLIITKAEWRWAVIWAVALVAITTLPYVVAYGMASDDLFYTGFLSNPEDGHTYVAKMRQGWRGDWLLHLPFTPEPHPGVVLLTYYLFLGHLARWIHLPLIVMYHLARAINGFVLLLSLYYILAHFFQDIVQRRFAFALTALGSGFGWLTTLLGWMTVDMWVPEGYILYSAFVNPHFPLAIAVMLLVTTWSVTPWGATRVHWRRLVGVALGTAALGVLQPFCLLTIGTVLLVYALARWARRRRLPWREIASGMVLGVVGLPFAVNAYLISTRHSLFAAWSAQNQTLSPPPWDYAAGYGVVALLAIVGVGVAVRRRRDSDLLLLIWTACTAALLYAPFSLQRRLVMGLIVPLGALAAMGWYVLPQRRRPRQAAMWTVAGLTHLFLIGITLVGAFTYSEALYMTRDERAALHWLAEEIPQDTLIAAAPQTGLYIPAWSGQRVFYGHRFETAHADVRRAQVTAFFETGDLSALGDLRPDYVFYGPRERALAPEGWQPDPTWSVVYRGETITIYAIPGAE